MFLAGRKRAISWRCKACLGRRLARRELEGLSGDALCNLSFVYNRAETDNG